MPFRFDGLVEPDIVEEVHCAVLVDGVQLCQEICRMVTPFFVPKIFPNAATSQILKINSCGEKHFIKAGCYREYYNAVGHLVNLYFVGIKVVAVIQLGWEETSSHKPMKYIKNF